MDSKAITLFVNDKTSKYYKEIPLSEILYIDSALVPRAPGNILIYIKHFIIFYFLLKINISGPMHCFELKTTNLEYYVGGEEQNLSGGTNVEDNCSDTWTKGEKDWESIIQQALMPVPSNPTS